jgi:hypothetical protein
VRNRWGATTSSCRTDGGTCLIAATTISPGSLGRVRVAGGGTGIYEFAAGITAAQDIWYQTTGTLLQRQADLRPLLGGTQVTPVADFSEPVAPTPAGQVGPGFWLKCVGA